MAKKLAIEWDSHSLRMVVGRQRGSSVVVEQALHFPLAKAGEEAEKGSLESKVGRLLSEQISAHGIGKLPTIIGVNRSSIELQMVAVPPVPDDELPDIVRYQAMRECTNLGEDGTVDFVKLPPSDDGKLRVQAAAISAKQLNSIQKICNQAQVQPQSYAVRSFGAAYLAASQSRFSGISFLLIENLGEHAELTVVCKTDVLLTRSTRIPGDPGSEHARQFLQGEIRRTMLAAQAKSLSEPISQIVILGDPQDAVAWKSLGEQLKVSVDFLAPLAAEHVTSSADVASEVSSQMGALVGMLLEDAATHHPSIDLLNPRRRPDPPDRRRLYTLAGLAAASIVLVIGYVLYSGVSSRDTEIADLKAEIAKLKNTNKPLVEAEQEVVEIDDWLAADVQWLDEFYRMSEKLPSADELIVSRIHMQPGSSRGGTTTIEGYVADQSVITKIEASLIGDQHQVLGKGTQERAFGDQYTISFQEYVTITPEENDRFAPQEDSEEELAMEEKVDESQEVKKETKPEEEVPKNDTEETPAKVVSTTGEPS